jgi:VWFA-related protein
MKSLLAFLAASLVYASPQANEQPAVATIHAETRVVQVDVVVTDSHGRPVSGLKKEDFSIRDEGKPRFIDIFVASGSSGRSGGDGAPSLSAPRATAPQLPPRTFSNRNVAPPELVGHSTILILDQVNAYIEDAAYARNQVIALMKRVPQDERIALYVMARKQGLVLIQDYTTDRSLLVQNLNKYVPHGIFPSPGLAGSSANKSGDPSPVGKTLAQANEFAKGTDQSHPPGLANTIPPPTLNEKIAMWDENSRQARLTLKSLAERLALVPGRKSVYWITQAFPLYLLHDLQQPAWEKTYSELNEANVAVNTVDSRGLFRGADPNHGTIASMQTIAEATGGKAYFGRNDLDTAIEEGIEASRGVYTLGFYLDERERDNRFHSLQVKAARAGLNLFYRQGYYAGAADLPVEGTDRGDIESVLSSPMNATGIRMTVRVDSVSGKTAKLRLNMDLATFPLTEHGADWTGKVEETFIEQDRSGNTLGKVSDIREFELTPVDRARYETEGVAWPFTLPLADGAVKVTIIVRDSKTGRTGSLSVPLP